MATHTGGFETGVNGATIATTDTGNADAWTTVTIGSGAAVTYDNAHPAHGTLAAKLVTTTAANPNLQWSPSVALDHYGRTYFYFLANPGSSEGIVLTVNGGRINLSTTGKLEARDAGGSLLATMTNAIALNQWIRVEWHMFHNASTGTFEILLFNSPDSATPTETLTLTALNMGSAPTFTAFGMTNGTLASFTMYLDNIVEYATAYPGPFPVNSVAPTVSGSTPVGSTLTASAGTYNGTFTLTYQWQQAGVDIVGATSSTYVTQAGDDGKAIGVREIATGQQATNESITTTSSNTVTVTSGGATSGSASGGVNFPTSLII